MFGLMGRPVREWKLLCGHIIICDENHRIGEKVYCTKCNLWTKVFQWRYYE